MRRQRLSKQKFDNCLKLGLALQITKDGLEDYVNEGTAQFHDHIVQKLQTNSPCNECRTENVLECPTSGVCNRKHCSFHNSVGKQPRKCPNSTCTKVRDHIQESHRFGHPSWQNTDATQWVSDSFQIAKCFVSPEECCYSGIKSIKELGFDGILSIIINNNYFQNKVTANLSEEINAFSKARDVGRMYHQHGSLFIADTDLAVDLHVLQAVLTDSKCLLYDRKAQNAVLELKQLEAGTLTISTGRLIAVINDALAVDERKAPKRQCSKGMGTQEQNVHKVKLRLLLEIPDLFTFQAKKLKCSQIGTLLSEKRSLIDDLKEAVKQFQMSLDKERCTTSTHLPEKSLSLGKRDRNTHEDAHRSESSKRPRRSSEMNRQMFEEDKTDFKRNLIDFYQERHSTLPLSPLIRKNKAPLLDFYVPPKIYKLDLEKELYGGKEYSVSREIENIEDIFDSKSLHPKKNICLVSPPGTGKTSFVKKLALTWCQAHHPVKDKAAYFNTQDLETMKRFQFLFVIFLRDVQLECEEDAMIQICLISQLELEYKYDNEFLQNVLHEETCLIIMDGLDEWKHPKLSNSFCRQTRSNIPHRKVRSKCTHLSTSRPWTLNKVLCENIVIDQHLEMSGLGKSSSNKLIQNVIAYLSRHAVYKEMTTKNFLKMLDSKGLQKFESNPIILMQLLCLWFEGTDPGESQSEIYSNILELLFKRAEQNETNQGQKGKHKKKLPTCFLNAPTCKRNAKTLHLLGKLAFTTLFPRSKEPSFVFGRSLVKEHLEEKEVQQCLRVGILCQNDELGKLADERVNVSFLHKTFQEFFAALYLTSKRILHKDIETRIFENHASLETILQLETVLIFISGFSPSCMETLVERTKNILARNTIIHQYRTNVYGLFLEKRNYIYDFCHMIVKSAKESICNKQDGLDNFYLEDVIIDKECEDEMYTTALSQVIETNKNNIKSVTIQKEMTIDDKKADSIMAILNLQTLHSIEKLYIWGKIADELLQSLLLNSKVNLKCLELWGMSVSSNDINLISKLDNLEGVSLLGISASHDVLKELMSTFEKHYKLQQVIINNMKCIDHSEFCPGCDLRISEKSLPTLFMVDKVHLTSIHVNAKKLQHCVIEWLDPPSALQSFLQCLKNAHFLERFDYEGHTSATDTRFLLETVSNLTHLKYLRLRLVDLNESYDINITSLKNLKRVHLCNVTMKIEILQHFITQVASIGTSIMVLIDYWNASSPSDYHEIKEWMRSSEAIQIIGGEGEQNGQLHFETLVTPSGAASSKAYSRKDDNAWSQCLCKTSQEALNIADILLKNNSVPKKGTLNRLCEHFGKKDIFFLHLCHCICAYIKSKSRKIVHVYSSYQMLHQNEIVFVVFVEESLSKSEEFKIRHNCKVEIRMLDKYSPEGQLVMHSTENCDSELPASEIETVKRCLDKFAADLMEKHKYLSLIRASPVRSKDYEKGEGKIWKETCVALYVPAKNYIPTDEEPFQSNYDGIPVDVREGGFVLYTSPRADERHEHIKMGCKISRDKLKGTDICHMSGTLGGFVQHPKYGLCGFTCAHALLHHSELEELKDMGGILHWPYFGELEAISQPEKALNEIGRLVQAVYKEGVNGGTGVEVALFQVEKRYPIDGDFPSSQTQASQDLRFDSGTTYGCSRLNADAIVKFGYKTNKTFGKFLMKQGTTCVRTQKHKLKVQTDFEVILYNQLEVRSIPDSSGRTTDFAYFGDSGSLVFMKGEDDEYVCVGMLEGGTSDGTAVVTPITPILELLDVSKLKSFKKEKQARELQGIQRDVRTILQDIQDLKLNMPQASQTIYQREQKK
ncbi:uncharacterized protein LOC128548329 [Mercenaria mercenaria]|uniref:uncharacterized protein LOC128548329 n=1 Tax=Mercenaria mercenaria TaxID=6596 RepID=UPI00234EB101|nr:uncharacterized protein LOC128548329 [Mercenaria mercenaria]XP_053378819.1 uncharacterized protein LOC128548329 [Mercenaria mercenaria]